MNATPSARTLPPVCWENASLQQIWESLNPTESEEDVYRVVDQFGEWATTLDDHMRQHELRWTEVAGGGAQLAAANFGARTRSGLATGVDDLYQVQSSLETLTATFVEVRRRVDLLHDEAKQAREPLLDWVLARDDERHELTRRDNTQSARELMRQYEQVANDELSRWPAEVTRHTDTTSYAGGNATDTVPIRHDDSPTTPTKVDHQTGGGALAGATRVFDGEDFEHQNKVWAGDDGAFGGEHRIAPPVIGAGFELEEDEDDPW
jgi:hypothetical protein